MVQFLFVHGVNNRKTPQWLKAQDQRDAYIKEFVFGPNVTIANPYWGDLGANPPDGGYKALPDYDNPTGDGVETLNVGEPTRTDAAEAPPLVVLAREDFPETVDLILQGILEAGEQDNAFLEAVKMLGDYAAADPKPSWIAADLNDTQFMVELEQRAQQFAQQQAASTDGRQTETLGLGSWIKDGAKKLTDRVRNAGGRLALAAKREDAHTAVAYFIGDVFVYLKDTATREPIRQRLKDALLPAIASGEPVVAMGHSMGGVILVDSLADPAFCEDVGLSGGKTIDALLTVGSQPGFFHELDLLETKGTTSLPTVKHWLNIYDEVDVLSFRAAPFFKPQARDMLFSSKTGLIEAHNAYFVRVQFYRRLRARLVEMGIVAA